jgi:oligoendopeptidase F
MLNTHSKIHHFNDYIHATTFADEINIDLITNLYSEVKKYKPLYIKYREITSNLLKKQLHLNYLEP